MRRIAWMTLVLAASLPLTGAAATMTLGHDGTLYRFGPATDNLGLVLEIVSDADALTIPVPQTLGMDVVNLSLGVDEANGTVVTIWEERVDDHLSRVHLATYNEGTWWGPTAVAGEEWGTSGNPVCLLRTTRSTAIADDGSISEVATTFIHLAWWVGLHDADGGYAVYSPIELTSDGIPLVESADLHELGFLAPWGLECSVVDTARTLAHPKLFVDPETGDPHLLVASLTDCLFAIFRLHADLADDEIEDELESHRRRHVVILGRTRDIAIAPGLRLDNASIQVGHGMSVVAHWDDDGLVRYVTMNESGWSKVRALELGPQLDHEAAVNLIRGLAR